MEILLHDSTMFTRVGINALEAVFKYEDRNSGSTKAVTLKPLL